MSTPAIKPVPKRFTCAYGSDFGVEAHLTVGEIDICTDSGNSALKTLSAEDARALGQWLIAAADAIDAGDA